ncbi:MAG: hypothetical protein KJ767_02230 [Nanoarchaeota archaeon]|nr:hypothetical protein [Nanoarchaeota archaeon]
MEKAEKEVKTKKKLSKKEKLERSVSWIIGIILISILIVVAIFFIRQKYFGPTFEYKDYKVTRVMPEGTTAIMYVLRVPIRIYGSTDIYYIYLRNDPRELQDIPVDENTRKTIIDPKPSQVYLTFDPEMGEGGKISLATMQLARILGTSGVFRLNVNGAVTKDIGGLEDKKITCEDSSSLNEIVVIEFEYGEETKISVDKNYWRCIKIQAKNGDELIKAADKAILTLLGI